MIACAKSCVVDLALLNLAIKREYLDSLWKRRFSEEEKFKTGIVARLTADKSFFLTTLFSLDRLAVE